MLFSLRQLLGYSSRFKIRPVWNPHDWTLLTIGRLDNLDPNVEQCAQLLSNHSVELSHSISHLLSPDTIASGDHTGPMFHQLAIVLDVHPEGLLEMLSIGFNLYMHLSRRGVLELFLLACAKNSRSTVRDATPMKRLVLGLLELGADPNCVDEPTGLSVLGIAAAAGSTWLVKMLLAHDAQAGMADLYGRSALHVAVAGGQLECAAVLLGTAGADPFYKDECGRTPIELGAVFTRFSHG